MLHVDTRCYGASVRGRGVYITCCCCCCCCFLVVVVVVVGGGGGGGWWCDCGSCFHFSNSVFCVCVTDAFRFKRMRMRKG